MRLILKLFLIALFFVGLNAFAVTTDYVSAFKPKNKVQTLSEFQKNLNFDLYKTRREVMSEYNNSVELVKNNNSNPSEKPVEI